MSSADAALPYPNALTHLRDGRAAEAAAILRAILARDPNHAGARRNLIRALLAARDHDAVLAETTLALAGAPESAELRFLHGTALNGLSRPLEARAALTTSVGLNPNRAPAWLNLGNACVDLDDLDAAEAHCRHALTLDPGLVEARVSLGFILTSRQRPREAIAELEQAIRTDPANVHAHWNLATAALLAGDLPRGFAEYEWRKKHDLFRRDFIDLPGPVWDGSDPTGRTILVHAEQGLGDTIQFARYLPLIAQRGGMPILACEPSLIPLLKTIATAGVVSKFDPLPPFDAWIDQMSLPRVFGTTLSSIPSPAGYLTAPVASPSATKIGLAWAGNPLHRNDRRRTPPPAAFEPLLAGREIVSLIPGKTLPGLRAPDTPLTDYAETAALIAGLDLIVTVDTSVAHVAGALGRPAWVLLPYAPDWRWLLLRNDTPWYSSLRLFRQPEPGDWRSVIAEIVTALAART